MKRLAALMLVLLAAGCGGAAAGDTGRAGSIPRSPGPGSSGPPARVEGDGFVLDVPGRGPQLCLGAVAESYPPQCSGLTLRGWRWGDVAGEERFRGTRWGSYHVVGTLDGEVFTVLRAGPPELGGGATPGLDPFRPPCPEPVGGWRVVDFGATTDARLRAALTHADRQRDAAGSWISYLERPPAGADAPPPGRIVLVAAFTGEVERHRADLRRRWGGPLCVVRRERSLAELRRIQDELTPAGGAALGLEVLTSDVDVLTNRVELGVVTVDAAARAAIAARYGAGTVRVTPALRPVR